MPTHVISTTRPSASPLRPRMRCSRATSSLRTTSPTKLPGWPRNYSAAEHTRSCPHVTHCAAQLFMVEHVCITACVRLDKIRPKSKIAPWHLHCSAERQPRSSRILREGKQPSISPACASGGVLKDDLPPAMYRASTPRNAPLDSAL